MMKMISRENEAINGFKKRAIELLNNGYELNLKIQNAKHPNEPWGSEFMGYMEGLKRSINIIEEIE